MAERPRTSAAVLSTFSAYLDNEFTEEQIESMLNALAHAAAEAWREGAAAATATRTVRKLLLAAQVDGSAQ